MSNYLLVTTFNHSGYQKYGRNMLNAFLKQWPTDQQIIVYTENVDIDPSIKQDSRVIVRDLLSSVPLVDFKQRHANNPKANGFWPQDTKNFLFDAVRFSHKVFALYETVKNNPTGAQNIVWLDADTITHSPVPFDFLSKNFPSKGFGVSYLGRTEQYSECGWVVYHMATPQMYDFWETFANYYKNDTIFDLPEWHDSFVFDIVRKEYEAKGMVNHNITPGFVRGHPFINCVLGDYMDHMKGPRKDRGRSAKTERLINTGNKPGWWT